MVTAAPEHLQGEVSLRLIGGWTLTTFGTVALVAPGIVAYPFSGIGMIAAGALLLGIELAHRRRKNAA